MAFIGAPRMDTVMTWNRCGNCASRCINWAPCLCLTAIIAMIAYVLHAAQGMALETAGMSASSKTAGEMCSASLIVYM